MSDPNRQAAQNHFNQIREPATHLIAQSASTPASSFTLQHGSIQQPNVPLYAVPTPESNWPGLTASQAQGVNNSAAGQALLGGNGGRAPKYSVQPAQMNPQGQTPH